MAEAAACIAPGRGLIGIEQVTAARWIDLIDTDRRAIRISARLQPSPSPGQALRIAAAIHVEEQTRPAIEAVLLFGHRYEADEHLPAGAADDPPVWQTTGEAIYEQRHMFHGPLFQCLTGPVQVSKRGVQGQLLVKPQHQLFQSTRHPQLLLDPALLDGVGQLFGIWASQHDRVAFPIGLQKLQLHQARPPVDTCVPIRLEITRNDMMTCSGDVDIFDGSGNIWMSIRQWSAFKFRWSSRLVAFRRQPTRHTLSDAISLPAQANHVSCHLLEKRELANFDRELLARSYLQQGEMAAFAASGDKPGKQEQWLMGRITAKDAVRRWLAPPEARLHHPASFAIANEPQGQPYAAGLTSAAQLPFISIAHCDGFAIALAAPVQVGVDIETVQPRAADFTESICKPAELTLLRQLEQAAPAFSWDEWITRLWCAKEAAGKLLGTGLLPSPRQFVALSIDIDGRLLMQTPAARQRLVVHTLRMDSVVIAHSRADEQA